MHDPARRCDQRFVRRDPPSPPAEGLRFWGSDCTACGGNTTPGSMRCDDCARTDKTVALWAAE
jgi:hypothetical protein